MVLWGLSDEPSFILTFLGPRSNFVTELPVLGIVLKSDLVENILQQINKVKKVDVSDLTGLYYIVCRCPGDVNYFKTSSKPLN